MTISLILRFLFFLALSWETDGGNTRMAFVLPGSLLNSPSTRLGTRPEGNYVLPLVQSKQQQLLFVSTVSALFSKKGSAGSNAPTASKKIKVKMLKQVTGTGQAGEIILVTPAFFRNKLQPSKSAVIISDEEIEIERAKAEADEKKRAEDATVVKAKLESLSPVIMKRKAGPDGHLFGGIGPKTIMEEVLSNKVPDHRDFLGQKSVKIISILDESTGKELKGDIKYTGDFATTIALTKTINAKFTIHVQQES